VTAPLRLSREAILAFRRRVQALDERLPAGPRSLQRAAWAGLQDSVPRSALHSLHARVAGVRPDSWEDPALVQVWGPRHAAYVVPADAHAAFTLARMPDSGRLPARARAIADRAAKHLHGGRQTADVVARSLGIGNDIRYASLTGTILIRWAGARQPVIWAVQTPRETSAGALQELVRRYLHVYGPSSMESFVRWGGLDARRAAVAFSALGEELLAARTPLGDAWLLAADGATIPSTAADTETARLLPSGDPYYLLWNADRALLVPDRKRRAVLWTTRVWPGALLLGGEIVGTWRRSKVSVTISPWRRLHQDELRRVEDEAATLPIPDTSGPIVVRWER
jgi:hypothetical protein